MLPVHSHMLTRVWVVGEGAVLLLPPGGVGGKIGRRCSPYTATCSHSSSLLMSLFLLLLCVLGPVSHIKDARVGEAVEDAPPGLATLLMSLLLLQGKTIGTHRPSPSATHTAHVPDQTALETCVTTDSFVDLQVPLPHCD